jgi:hypothetical protein
VNTSGMDDEELLIPLVDEPIGEIIEQVQASHPEIDRLVSGPRTILAFRTFAYLRVGILLGRLLVENDIPEYDGSETWVEALLRDERNEQAVVDELHAVAREVASDPRYVEDEPIGPDEAARDRFREFARKHRD